MEHMFLPTRRLQDRWEEVADLYYDVELFENYTEVQLVVPVEVFLDYRWDWADLWALHLAMLPRGKLCGSQTKSFLRSVIIPILPILLNPLCMILYCLLLPQYPAAIFKRYNFLAAKIQISQKEDTKFSGVR